MAEPPGDKRDSPFPACCEAFCGPRGESSASEAARSLNAQAAYDLEIAEDELQHGEASPLGRALRLKRLIFSDQLAAFE